MVGVVRVPVTTGNPYEVTIGGELLDNIISSVGNARVVAVFYQSSVESLAEKIRDALVSTGIAGHLLLLPDAEAGKTLDVANQCWDACAEIGLSRQDTVIAVGGGAATDVAGFVAATWMRGVRLINVPTTLLGMVDAAIGGKTGINTSGGKNLVGVFHEPSAVFVDLNTLKTLPERELISGMAEIVKAGFIADPEILTLIESDPKEALNPSGIVLPELIERAVRVKAVVVSQDLEEAGLREILNYGHTLGHAVERRENYRWRHGNAVAVGMCFAAELGRLTGQLDDETADRHMSILESLGLPTTYAEGVADELIKIMYSDKKSRKGKLRFVILGGLGQPTRLVDPDTQTLYDAYGAINSPVVSQGGDQS